MYFLYIIMYKDKIYKKNIDFYFEKKNFCYLRYNQNKLVNSI